MAVDIINKIVKIDNPQTLTYFYPNFIIVDSIFMNQRDNVIYTGKYEKGLASMLAQCTNSFISTVGAPVDYDLDNKDTLIDMVYSKFNKTPNAKTLEMLKTAQDHDFMQYIKRYWVLGSSKFEEHDGPTIFNLYQVLGKSKYESLNIYFKLLDTLNFSLIEHCVINFIEKAVFVENINAKPQYKKLLTDFKNRLGDRLKKILLQYYKMQERREVKLQWLIYSLGV